MNFALRIYNDRASKRAGSYYSLRRAPPEISMRRFKILMNKESYTALDYINDAIHVVNLRLSANSEFSLYSLAKAQLEYIKRILIGAESDKSKLHTLNLGALASKEFDTTDEELAGHLSNANYIASQMAQGLKVILPHEQDTEYLKRQKRYKKFNSR